MNSMAVHSIVSPHVASSASSRASSSKALHQIRDDVTLIKTELAVLKTMLTVGALVNMVFGFSNSLARCNGRNGGH